MADRRRVLPSSTSRPYIRSRPGVEEEHEPRQKSSEARADRQRSRRQASASTGTTGGGPRASIGLETFARKLREKTASHEMLMSGGRRAASFRAVQLNASTSAHTQSRQTGGMQ